MELILHIGTLLQIKGLSRIVFLFQLLFTFFHNSRSIQKRLIFRWLANKIFLDPNRIKQLKNNMQLFIPHLDFWKSRSVSNLIKNSVPVHLIFFFSLSPDFFQVYGTNLKKIQLTNWKKIRSTEKKIRCAGPEIFLRFETDLNFSRPWFSEKKVQIKWPIERPLY